FIFYRMMGKREIGELKVVDLVVSMLLANIASSGIEDYSNSIFLSLVPVLALVLLQIIVSKISLRYAKVRKVVDGSPSVIINRGKVNFKEMLEQRYNLDDLLMELRSQGIKSIEEVDYAILEISGRLSVFVKDDDKNYPLPVILDGKVDEDVLLQIGKDKDWLSEALREENLKQEEVFYGFYRDGEMFLIKNDIK
ncbi:MAG: DUF421 domain-containing protein, partial [Mycoplasmatota bacterium]|nr:DUF421 domain-containing protein [Mycoplasmatota bacterium]